MTAAATYVELSFPPATLPSPAVVDAYDIEYRPLIDGTPIQGSEALQGPSPIRISAGSLGAGPSLKFTLNGLFRDHDYVFQVSPRDTGRDTVGAPMISGTAHVPRGFTWLLPRPHDGQIQAAQCLPGTTPRRCYVAGQNGFFARIDDGADFGMQPLDTGWGENYPGGGSGAVGFFSMSFPDSNRPDVGYLAGRAMGVRPGSSFSPMSGALRKTVDGGRTWADVSPTQSSNVIGGHVACVSVDECWYSDGVSLWRTTDGARNRSQSWTKLLDHCCGAGVPPEPRSLLAVDPSTLYSLAADRVWRSASGGALGAWEDLGIAWSDGAMSLDRLLGSDGKEHAMVVGDGVTWPSLTATDGDFVAFNASSLSLPIDGSIRAARFTSNGGGAIAVGGGGQTAVYRSTDYGVSFTPDLGDATLGLQSRDRLDLLGAEFVNDDEGMVWGSAGPGIPQIWTTRDFATGAASWIERTTGLPHWRTNAGISPANFTGSTSGRAIDSETFVACDDAGYLLFTRDGGSTFATTKLDLAICRSIAVTNVTPNRIYAVAAGASEGFPDTVLLGIDRSNGAVTQSPSCFSPGIACQRGTCPANGGCTFGETTPGGWLEAITLMGNDGVAVGTGPGEEVVVFTTSNGGVTWNVQGPVWRSALKSVVLLDRNTFFALAPYPVTSLTGLVRGTRRTDDSWQLEQLDIGDMFTDVWPRGGTSLEIWNGVLYVFANEGLRGSQPALMTYDPAKPADKAWTLKLMPDIAAANGCDVFPKGGCCADANNCIVVGGNPSGGECAAPTLVTHDGGTTWRTTYNWSSAPVRPLSGCSIAPGSNGVAYLWGQNGALLRTDTFAE